MKKFAFLLKTTESCTSTKKATSAWPWPTCVISTPRTLSFRTTTDDDEYAAATFRPTNSAAVYVQENDYDDDGDDSAADEIQVRSSDRLFFEPSGETNSIMEGEAETVQINGEEGSTTVMAVTIDSFDPFMDFRVSMEEMIIAGQLRRRWESLEDLLRRYLQVNAKRNHCYIIGAFVDLLLNLSLTDEDDDNGDGNNSSCSCSNDVMKNRQGSYSPLSSLCSFTRSSSMEEVSEGLVASCEKMISGNSYSSFSNCEASSSFSSGFL